MRHTTLPGRGMTGATRLIQWVNGRPIGRVDGPDRHSQRNSPISLYPRSR